MSAFLCSDDTIRLVAMEAAREFSGRIEVVKATEFARTLYAANVAALQDRYGDGDQLSADDAPEVRHADIVRLSKPAITVLKCTQCYEYQACDWREYDGSAAQDIVQAALGRAIGRLSGYNDAPWGLR